jgi:hypothetical protein
MAVEKNIPSQNWKTDIKDWRKLSKDTADFILAQAETLLKETLDTANSITVRAERIITLQVPLLVGLLVYIFNNLKDISHFLPLTAVLCATVIISSIAACYNNFKKNEIDVPGEYPKNILSSRLIENKFDEKEQYLNMVINQCENFQLRIDKNDKLNVLRMKRNMRSLNIFIFGLTLCPVVGYLASVYLEQHS